MKAISKDASEIKAEEVSKNWEESKRMGKIQKSAEVKE